MGTGLSKPLVNKHLTRLESRQLLVGTAEMQGYRVDMEDDFVIDTRMDDAEFMKAIPSSNMNVGDDDNDDDDDDDDREFRAVFVGVFDGHVGGAASVFLAKTLADSVREMPDLQNETWRNKFMEVDKTFCSTLKKAGSTCVTVLLHKDPLNIDEPDTVPLSKREKGMSKTEGSPTDEENSGDGSGNASASASASDATGGNGDESDDESEDDGKGGQDKYANEIMRRLDTLPSSEVPEGKSDEWYITVCNVGDSRCMVGHADGSWEAMTRDHKPSDPEELKRIQEANGHVSWNRVNGQLALSRAFGDLQYKGTSHLPAKRQQVIAWPDVTRAMVKPGDWILICCDGIFEGLKNVEVAQFVHNQVHGRVQRHEKLDTAQIMSALLDHSLLASSHDNMSAVLLIVSGNGVFTQDMTTDIGLQSEYVAEELPYSKLDQSFVRAYCDDAAKFGRVDLLSKLEPMIGALPSVEDHKRLNEYIVSTVCGACSSPHLLQDQRGDEQGSRKRKFKAGK